jgi:hypothetical protein
MIGGLFGGGFDRGDRDDMVRCKSYDALTAGPFPGTLDGEIPCYHDHAGCRETQGEENVRNIERREAKEYAVPCPECVVPAGVASDGDLATPRDVADAMDDPPDLVVDTIEVTD